MRTDERREEIVRLLRRSGSWTTEALAAEVGASRRTVLRDLNALRDRGFDIPGLAGPGGGVRLEPTSVLVSSTLRTEELVALILTVEIARSSTSVPFAAGAERALAKLETALPAARAREVQAFSRRIVVGTPTRGASAPLRVDQRLVSVFEQGFTSGSVLRFLYEDRNGRRSWRRVEPHGLLVRVPHWYAITWDCDKAEPRLFRADRMRRPAVTAQAFALAAS